MQLFFISIIENKSPRDKNVCFLDCATETDREREREMFDSCGLETEKCVPRCQLPSDARQTQNEGIKKIYFEVRSSADSSAC